MDHLNHSTRSLALTIGLDGYQALPRFPGAVRGADAMAHLLRRLYRFEVATLFNQQATRGAITRELDRLAQADRAIVYYAGRMVGSSTLATYNTDPKAPTTGIALDRLVRQLDTLPVRHVLLILDITREPLNLPNLLTPFSVNPEPLADRFESRSRLVIGAGLNAWQSRDRWGDEDASLFTAHVLNGLRANAADRDGAITGDLLAAYLLDELPRFSGGQATPWASHLSDATGDMRFRESAPLELPSEVTDGLRNGFPSLRYRSVAQIALLVDRGDPVTAGLAIEKLREVAAENDSANVRQMAVDELLVRNLDPDGDGLPMLRQPPPPRPGAAPPPDPSEMPPPPMPGDRLQTIFMIGVMLMVAATVIFLIVHFS